MMGKKKAMTEATGRINHNYNEQRANDACSAIAASTMAPPRALINARDVTASLHGCTDRVDEYVSARVFMGSEGAV